MQCNAFSLTLRCIVHCIVSQAFDCLFCNAMQFYSVYHIILHYTTLCIAMVYTRGQYRCPQLVLGCPNFNTMQSYIVNYFAFYCITLHHEKVRYRCPQLVFGCPYFNTIQSYIINYIAFYHVYIVLYHIALYRTTLCIAIASTRGQYRCPQLALGCPNFNTMQS